jgi:hypothetical protein
VKPRAALKIQSAVNEKMQLDPELKDQIGKIDAKSVGDMSLNSNHFPWGLCPKKQ